MGTRKRAKSAGKTPAQAVHATRGHEHLVGCMGIRVLVLNDDGEWFAQGLEIDFAASGSSLEEAKKNFASDLARTIHEHLKIKGNIESVLQVAPQSFWTKYFELAQTLKFSLVSMHDLSKEEREVFPFEKLHFLQADPEQARVA